MCTTKKVKLINKKEFAKAVLDEQSKIFVVYIAVLETPEKTIYLLQIAQILGSDPVQVVALKQNKAFIKVSIKYSDFLDVFLEEKTLVLSKQTNINEHAIELEY